LIFGCINGSIDVSLKSDDGKEYVSSGLTANPEMV